MGATVVERFLAEVEGEKARLRAEIEQARSRAERARTGSGAHDQSAEQDLGGLVLAAQRQIAELEREHRHRIAGIRAAAVREADRLTEATRQEVDAVRAAAETLPGSWAAPGRPQRGRMTARP